MEHNAVPGVAREGHYLEGEQTYATLDEQISSRQAMVRRTRREPAPLQAPRSRAVTYIAQLVSGDAHQRMTRRAGRRRTVENDAVMDCYHFLVRQDKPDRSCRLKESTM